eukprot:RCo015027
MASAFLKKPVNIAPEVFLPEPDYYLPQRGQATVPYNSTVDRMYAPVYGPSRSSSSTGPDLGIPTANVPTGFFEKSALSDWAFTAAFRDNNVEGCPEDAERDREAKRRKLQPPKEGQELSAEQLALLAPENDEEDDDDSEGDGEEGGASRKGKKALRLTEDQSHVDPARMALVAKKGGNALSLPGDEEKEGLSVYFEIDEKRGKRVARFEAIPPKSTLHIKQAYDYQGRSFLHDPLKDPDDRPAFLPKKLLHTWRGHNKGVQAIKWCPPHGHLLLSAGLDGKVKLWDVCNTREVIQTYLGHAKAVKDIAFGSRGARFVSAGFDRFLRVWDTETGKVLYTFTTGKQPNVVTFHADESRHDIFLAGMSDKKIVQWDLRSAQITQEYEQHMGPVNTIHFIDNNRKFATTSDDKTVRVWEWDIPVVIKYFAEPTMHSMPTCTQHPSGKYLAYQSMDNSIRIFQLGERFRPFHKKVFKGHTVAGYACQVAWSNDGKYLCSGDGDGNVWFWDWKSTKIVKRMKVHDKVCIGLLWHPTEQSRIATCSWDSTVKFWD